MAAIYNLTQKKGYPELVLNFESCTASFAQCMLPLCATISELRSIGIETKIIMPLKKELNRLFINANWGYLIEPSLIPESEYMGLINIPAENYMSTREQQTLVNKLMDSILRCLKDLNRTDIPAIEWAINEITDNVLVHSRAKSGGFIQLSNNRRWKRIEINVADAGIGIPFKIKQTYKDVTSDVDAIDKAIREGVTSGEGQGNGLFGTFQVVNKSGGYLYINSGYGKLAYEKKEMHIRNEQIPYSGTAITACIDLSVKDVLANALNFNGISYTPTDYVEMKYEMENEDDKIIFFIKKESTSLGSRKAGEPVRVKIMNLVRISEAKVINIDFSDVPLISSSFADEVIGKIFVELGAVIFMQKIKLVNVSQTVQSLIDRAILQRSAQIFPQMAKNGEGK